MAFDPGLRHMVRTILRFLGFPLGILLNNPRSQVLENCAASIGKRVCNNHRS